MAWLRRRWQQFWFEAVSPANLGCCRVLFFGLIFLLYLRYDVSPWAEVSEAFWKPTWLFRFFHLPVLPSEPLVLLQSVWKVALGLGCIGLHTRLSTATSFVLGAYLLGLPHCFGKIHHNEAAVVLVLGILAVSRCGDGLSLDRLRAPRGESVVPSGEYTWPVRMVWLLLALIFGAAGLAKLGRSGIEWVMSDNFAIMLIQNNYHKVRSNPLTTWGLVLAQHGWLCRLLAAATVAVELAYPLALFSRTVRWLVVPASCLLLIGIRVLLGPAFEQFVICQLFWVPWERVMQWLARAGDTVVR